MVKNGARVAKSIINNLRHFIRVMSIYECINAINSSMIIRIILTIVSLYFLSLSNVKFITENIYIIIPILLFLLDIVDGINRYILIYKGKQNKCTKTFDYQIKDKIVDVASYFYTYYLFNEDNNILYLSIYRLIGVLLFSITKSSKWLIIFFDFVKEYMIYIFLFKYNFRYLLILIIAKIICEYYFHTIVNKTQY